MMCRAIEDHSIDIIHAFHHSSYFLAQFAALRKNIPVVFSSVWYLDGPVFPVYPGTLIFVAREFLDEARGKIKGVPAGMTVIPNRIDLSEYRPGLDGAKFQMDNGLPSSGWKIAFMSRVDKLKFGSLRNAVEAVSSMVERGMDVTLAIAGDGVCFDELKKIAGEVNSRLGKEAVILLGKVSDTPGFLSWADIVLGIGRCIWEGMACGKPAIVVGENGVAGIAEPEKTELLQYYNFAGRNISEPVDPRVLADTIENLMNDHARYRELSAYSREYVIENYDYRTGAERIEKIYEDELSAVRLSPFRKIRVLFNLLVFGYGYRLYVALRIMLRGLLGRGRPEDRVAG